MKAALLLTDDFGLHVCIRRFLSQVLVLVIELSNESADNNRKCVESCSTTN